MAGVPALVQHLSVVCRAVEARDSALVEWLPAGRRELPQVELSLARAESAQVEVGRVVPAQD